MRFGREQDPVTARSRRAINAGSVVVFVLLAGGALAGRQWPVVDDVMGTVLLIGAAVLVAYAVVYVVYDMIRDWREATRRVEPRTVAQVWKAIARGKGDQ